MQRFSSSINAILEKTRQVVREDTISDNVGNTNSLLLRCHRNDELLRTLKNKLELCFVHPETSGLFSKYREIVGRYSHVVQGVSIVSSFAQMHFDLLLSTCNMQVIYIHLVECFKYCETRSRKLEVGLKEAIGLLDQITELCGKDNQTELGKLVLTFDEKLRIVELDTKESTEKIKEAHSAIMDQLTDDVPGTTNYLAISMVIMCGTAIGGFSSWLLGLGSHNLPYLVVVGVIGALLASHYNSVNSPKVHTKTIKLQYMKHRQKYDSAIKLKGRLTEAIASLLFHETDRTN